MEMCVCGHSKWDHNRAEHSTDVYLGCNFCDCVRYRNVEKVKRLKQKIRDNI
ncbi:hypothetical protein ES703_62091 [subsurface metagenome]